MSLFDLKTAIEDIESSNHGILRKNMRQVSCLRDVSANFSGSIQNYRWELSGTKWWVPSKSYFRIRCSLTKADGTPLELDSDIAPAMGLAGNLFQSIDFKMADQTVCRIDRNVAQIDVLKNRLSKSRSWNKSVGLSTNFYEQDFKVRQAMVCSDGLNIEQSPSGSAILYRNDFLDNSASLSAEILNLPSSGTSVFTLTSDADFKPAINDIEAGNTLYINNRPLIVAGINVVNERKVDVTVDMNIPTAPAGVVSGFFATQTELSITSATSPAKRSGTFEIIWKPPLGIFDSDTALPCGKYELLMSPASNDTLLKTVIESQVSDKKAGVDYKFSVNQCDFYVCEVDGPRVDDSSYLIDFETMRCQTNDIKSNSFGQRTFDVSPSTRNLVVAFQDARVGSNSLISPSKFRTYTTAISPHTTALRDSDQGLTLNRQYVSYGGQSLPNPDYNGSVGANIDYTTQGYIDSLIDAGALTDTGGSETHQEWQLAGPYYNMLFYRERTDMSTRVTVNSGFTGDVTNMRCLLFDNSSQVVQVKVQNSAIVSVSVADL